MVFFLEMVPPTVTAQMHRVMVRNGRPMFYDSPRLKEARRVFLEALAPFRPGIPFTGPVSLTVRWFFPSKQHRDGSWRVTRPDTDNLQKLLKDCMTEAGFWADDAQVCMEHAEKRWTRVRPGIEITVESC